MAHFSWIALTLLTAILTRAASTEATADNIMNSRRRNHSSLAHRLIPREEAQVLSKRSTPGRGTFYNIGQGDMGACGGSLDPNGFFVALNRPQYGDINSKSGNCGKTIVISHGGKSAHAVVLDACPECAYGALDLSPKLFQFFASKDVGVLDLTWTFEDDNHDVRTTFPDKTKKGKTDDLNPIQAAAAAKKVAEDNAARKAAEVETKKRAKEDMQKAKEDEQKAKADEEAAKKKEEEDKKRIKEEAEAEAKRIADKKAADDKKKEAAAENAKLKAIEDQKAKNAAAAAEEEKKSKDQRPTQPSSTPSKEEKVVVIKQQKKERKPTTNIASFSELVRGYDRIVQDGHAHLMRWIEPSCI